MFDILGFLVSWLTLFGIYAILSLCLNMEIGHTGMANTGLVAFFGIGAFITGYLSLSAFLAFFGYNYPIYGLDAIIVMGQISGKAPALSIGVFILCLVFSFLVAGTVGYIISYPTLRVGPAFLGITILSFGEMMRIFLKHFQPTGGAYGLQSVPNPFAWISDVSLKSFLFLSCTLAILALVLFYFQKLLNSPYGRVLRSIREDEVASLCMGKPVPGVKARLLFVASGMSGVAGSLLAFYTGAVTPDMFVTAISFDVWTMVILGGRGNNVGAVIGAAVVSLLSRASSIINFMFPNLIIDPNYARWMFMGAAIVIMLLYRPKGIFPEKRIETKAWSSFEGQETMAGRIRRFASILKRALNWLLGKEAV